mgnify:CR=1 FL=1
MLGRGPEAQVVWEHRHGRFEAQGNLDVPAGAEELPLVEEVDGPREAVLASEEDEVVRIEVREVGDVSGIGTVGGVMGPVGHLVGGLGERGGGTVDGGFPVLEAVAN